MSDEIGNEEWCLFWIDENGIFEIPVLITFKIILMFLNLAHTKTDIYKESKSLVLKCYRITMSFPSEEKFAMISQVRRAALSVHLNISEGCSRKSLVERKRFFEIARGSVIEIDAAIGIAFELKYCEIQSLQL